MSRVSRQDTYVDLMGRTQVCRVPVDSHAIFSTLGPSLIF